MASNVTATPATDSGANFTSPVFILPLTVSLAVLIAIFVAACVIYRTRQRKRTLELARRLRVTERRIDAIGTLKAKEEQRLAAPKADNLGLQCEFSSVGASAGTTRADRMPEEKEIRNALPYKTKVVGVRLGRAHVRTSTYPSQLESSYKGSSAATIQFQPQTREVANSSMAVECETIPSVSSFSTLQTGRNPLQSTHTATSYCINPSTNLGPGYNQRPVLQSLTIDAMNTSSHSVTSGQSVTGTWGSVVSTSKPPAPQVAVNNAAYFLRPTGGLAGGEEGRPVSDTTMEESSTGEGQKEKWV